ATTSRPPRRRRLSGIPGLRGTGWLGHVCAPVIVLAAVAAVVWPWVRPFPPPPADVSQAFVGPHGAHCLNFDSQGRDLFSRILVGARTAMLGGLAVVVLSMVAGSALAVVSAWRGGWVDTSTSAAVDIVFAFPGILLAVLMAAMFGASQKSAALS